MSDAYKRIDRNKSVPVPPERKLAPFAAAYCSPQQPTKTSGIVTRGNGAAERGKTARGPMA